jgi:hypothetical protein
MAFNIIGQYHMVDFIGSLNSDPHAIVQDGFHKTIKVVKVQCTFACDFLVLELDQRFPYHVQDKYPNACSWDYLPIVVVTTKL